MKASLKKGPLLLLLICTSFGAFAQKFALNTAVDAVGDKDYEEALEYIKKAQKHKNTKNKARTWFYTAKIMTGIATSKDTAVRNLTKNPAEKALDAIEKCKKLDKKNKEEDYRRKLSNIQAQLSGVIYQKGYDAYKKRDWQKAHKLFKTAGMSRLGAMMRAAKIKMHRNDDINNMKEAIKSLKKLDTTAFDALYYAGRAAEFMGKDSTALKMYKRVIGSGVYEGDAIVSAVGVLARMGKDQQMYRLIQQGLKQYPKHTGLLEKRAFYYIQKGELDSAEASLKKVIKEDSDNRSLRLVLAKIYQNFYTDLAKDSLGLDTLSSKDSTSLSNEYFSKAEKNFKAAIGKDSSKSQDALRGLGMLYYNKGVNLYKGGKKPAQEKGVKYWRKAIPLLEKVFDMNRNDKVVAESLMAMYARLGKPKKWKAVKKKGNYTTGKSGGKK